MAHASKLTYRQTQGSIGASGYRLSGQFPQPGALGNCRNCALRCSKLTGLVRNSAAPYKVACRRSSLPQAVTIMTGRSGEPLLDLAEQLQPVHAGQFDVGKDRYRCGLDFTREPIQCLRPRRQKSIYLAPCILKFVKQAPNGSIGDQL